MRKDHGFSGAESSISQIGIACDQGFKQSGLRQLSKMKILGAKHQGIAMPNKIQP